MKKILIYNWIPFDEKENKGGGVTVYTNNIIKNLCTDDEVELYFLSSGRAYNRKRRDTYIEATTNIYGEKCKSYQVVNSPILSSARVMFPFLDDYLEDRILKAVIRNFLNEIGGVDVIHFQNLEGLSLSVLELKEEFPQTKFVFSLHNYFPFCPAVMLWKEDKENCPEITCSKECAKCMQRDIYKFKVKFNQSIAYQASRGNVSKWDLRKQKFFEMVCAYHSKTFRKDFSERKLERYGEIFAKFQQKNVEYLNRYMDCILAVSKRVAEIAISKGFAEEKISVSYIGSDVASFQKGETSYPYDGQTFGIVYLGYMRAAKGFYFMLETLENMPPELAKKVRVTFASKVSDEAARLRIEGLKKKFAEVKLYDGYSRDSLKDILKGAQLGIVPVLWEDNLPQVAIEMKANGVPILSSNLGGAQELTASKQFVFKAGDQDDFLSKLESFVNEDILLDEYWKDCSRIISMDEHIKELKEKYYL